LPARPQRSAAIPERGAARSTATFLPYYWEAYNEIVEPRRFDHYLIKRWLPALGPLGFALVKALRDRCYHNPQTGVLRDECEVDLTELADSVGVSRATLVRELARNEALGHFIRRIRQFKMVDGRPRKDANAYQVSMDDPVHPSDLERYDDLRAIKEKERAATDSAPTRLKRESSSHKAQIEPNRGSYKAQIEPSNLSAQFESSDTKCLSAHFEPTKDNLPSGSFLTEDVLTPAAAPQPNGLPPMGEGSTLSESEGSSAPPELLSAWPLALLEIAQFVNRPTFHTHIKPLVPLDLTDEGEVALLVPSAFTRGWLEARHLPTLESALRKALKRDVTVRLTQITPRLQIEPEKKP
jgi:hypothetical protein